MSLFLSRSSVDELPPPLLPHDTEGGGQPGAPRHSNTPHCKPDIPFSPSKPYEVIIFQCICTCVSFRSLNTPSSRVTDVPTINQRLHACHTDASHLVQLPLNPPSLLPPPPPLPYSHLYFNFFSYSTTSSISLSSSYITPRPLNGLSDLRGVTGGFPFSSRAPRVTAHPSQVLQGHVFSPCWRPPKEMGPASTPAALLLE